MLFCGPAKARLPDRRERSPGGRGQNGGQPAPAVTNEPIAEAFLGAPFAHFCCPPRRVEAILLAQAASARA